MTAGFIARYGTTLASELLGALPTRAESAPTATVAATKCVPNPEPQQAFRFTLGDG